MVVAPVTFGVLLLLTGGLVLLLPGRPGGDVRGGRVRAVGVGLPLIGLGLVAVVIAVLQVGPGPDEVGAVGPARPAVGAGPPTWTPGPRLPEVPSTAEAGACLSAHLDQDPKVDKASRTTVRAGQTVPITGEVDSAVILVEAVATTGAVRFKYGGAGELTLTIYEVVDASCRPGTFTSLRMSNGFLVDVRLPDRAYELSVTYVDHPGAPTATLRRTG